MMNKAIKRSNMRISEIQTIGQFRETVPRSTCFWSAVTPDYSIHIFLAPSHIVVGRTRKEIKCYINIIECVGGETFSTFDASRQAKQNSSAFLIPTFDAISSPFVLIQDRPFAYLLVKVAKTQFHFQWIFWNILGLQLTTTIKVGFPDFHFKIAHFLFDNRSQVKNSLSKRRAKIQ